MNSIPEKQHHLHQHFPETPAWIKWENWRKQAWLTQIGTYEYGYDFKGQGNMDDIEVIYIGETHSSGFDHRLSSFEKPERHTGATKFKQRGLDESKRYVRVYPLPNDNKCNAALAQLIERELLWNYCLEHGEFPCLNDH